MSWKSRIFLAALVVAQARTSASAEAVTQLSHRDRLYDVTLAPSGHAYAIGHPGLLLRSKDGGKSFERVRAGQTDEALFSVAFNAAGHGAVVGRSGFFLTTRDQGVTWQKGTVDLAGEHPSLFSVSVLPDGVIVAVGEFGTIVRSDDQGKSWTRSSFTTTLEAGVGITTSTAPKATQRKQRKHRKKTKAAPVAAAPAAAQCVSIGSAEEENDDVVQEARLTDVVFLDAQHGLAVGEFGLVLRSEDGGRTFKRRPGCTDLMLYSIATSDRGRVIAVGAEGSVTESTDGGLSWARSHSGSAEHLFGVVTNARATVVLGAGGTALVRNGAGPFKAVDSGVHGWLTAAALDETGKGIVVGSRGYVRRSEDGVNTLQRVLGE